MASWANKQRILKRFARLPEGLRADVAAQLEVEVKALVAAEKRAAPVSELEQHPGQLRDKIEAYKTPDRPLSWRVIAGARDGLGRLFARFVEFGHLAKDGSHVPASPFWFPTYRALRKGIRARLMAAARKSIKRLFPEGASGF
jgi:hypothetical protein